MRLAFSIALALLPALFNGVGSRRLLRRREAADFAERLWRYRQRTTQLTMLCFLVVLVVGGWHAFWLAPTLLIGVLAAGFRLRRTLFEETWSFPAYLGFVVRLYLAFVGFWGLLALTPTLVWTTVEAFRWPAAILFASVLLSWSFYFSRLFPRILRAVPLGGADLAPFRERFDRVDGRSSAATPVLHTVPMNGGMFVNAVALPSLRRSAVLFWESLLRLFEPAEVGAIYAHEVAHLEQFHRRRLLRLAVAEWTMVLLAALLPPLLADRPELAGYLTGGWPFLVFGVVLLRAAGSRRRETDADLRALELCGDAEALTRALTRLHLLTRLPRRLALADEGRLSHPSLAHRLQAIRETAGRPADVGGEDRPAVPRPWPRVVATGDADRFVIFEPDRVSWLEGVAPEAGSDVEELRRSAASARTLVYGQLAELRVEPRPREPVLAARDVQGNGWEVPLAADSVADVQQLLDAVDEQLAPHTESSEPEALARVFLRLAAVLGLLLSLFPPMVFSLALPALVSLVRLRPASVGAFGVAGVAAAALRLGVMPDVDFGPETRAPISLLMLLLSVAVLVLAVRWARRSPERRRDWAWPTALINGVPAGVVLIGALVMIGLSGEIDPFSLSQTAFRLPGLVLLPLAAAAALLFVPTRTARALAMLAALAAVSVLAVGSSSFERRFVDDPLIIRASHREPAARRLEEVARLPMEPGAAELRLSPSGRRFAVASYSRTGHRWRLGRIGGPPVPAVELEVEDVRFLDESRILLLAEEAGSELANWTVELRALDGNESPSELAVVAGLTTADLTVEEPAERWWVTGSPMGSDYYQRQIGFTGTVGTEGHHRTSWEIPEVPDAGYVEWTPTFHGGALAVRWTYPVEAESDWLALAAMGGGAWNELWWVEDGEARRLASSRLDPTCSAAPSGPPLVLCLTHHRGQGHLWRVTPPAAGPAALEPLARFPSHSGAEFHWTENGLLVFSYSGDLWWWDRASSTLEELIVPDRSGFSSVALARSGVIGTLGWWDDQLLLVLHR